eukprot:8890555-Pyramimonas_sp.AAC.1
MGPTPPLAIHNTLHNLNQSVIVRVTHLRAATAAVGTGNKTKAHNLGMHDHRVLQEGRPHWVLLGDDFERLQGSRQARMQMYMLCPPAPVTTCGWWTWRSTCKEFGRSKRGAAPPGGRPAAKAG